MTQITASQVKELREKTGVGMMECKKALVETNGDVEKAIEELRKKGQAKAVKNDRIAAEGITAVAISSDGKTGVIVELNSETDFVAREASFKEFGNDVAKVALENNTANLADIKEFKLASGETVEETRLSLVAKLGENLSLRRVEMVTATGCVVSYLHGDMARVGALVGISTDNIELAKDLAMHIAASRPEYLDESKVPSDRLAKEKEILLAQARETNVGKPDDILEKIITGKVNKFLKEITLLGQAFVKDPNKTITQLLKESNAEVSNFIRFEVGEGIEKKTVDFAKEVAEQLR